tara:strand:- start:1465 stop:1638 length:174 start_codon:yes stop_codon:yes gene_type:complete
MSSCKNKVSNYINDVCENKRVIPHKSKYTPEKVFEGYKKPVKKKVKKNKKRVVKKMK